MDIFKVFFLFIIPIILLIAGYGAYDYGQVNKVY